MKCFCFVGSLIAGLMLCLFAGSLGAQKEKDPKPSHYKEIEVGPPELDKTYTLTDWDMVFGGKFKAKGKLIDMEATFVWGFLYDPNQNKIDGETVQEPMSVDWEIKFQNLKGGESYKFTVECFDGLAGTITASVNSFHLVEPTPENLKRFALKKGASHHCKFTKMSVNEIVEITKPAAKKVFNTKYRSHITCRGVTDLDGQPVEGYIIAKKFSPYAPPKPLSGKTIDHGRHWEIRFDGVDKLHTGNLGEGWPYYIVVKTTNNKHCGRVEIELESKP